MREAPARSTLSYANGHRPWEFFRSVFHLVLGEAQALAREKRRKFRVKNPLYSIDASTIDLCLAVFDWAHYKRAKGAVKLHLLLDHQGYLPCWAHITDGKSGDVSVARLLNLAAGAIVVMDRGYNDFRLFANWCARGVFFVTRMKEKTVYEVVESHAIPKGTNVLSDETIRLTGVGAEDKCPSLLRRVVVWDAENDREIVLLTNNFKLSAKTIGDIYKDRWQIELFFKALKQNLKVKTFLGTSENAVQSQLWTAVVMNASSPSFFLPHPPSIQEFPNVAALLCERRNPPRRQTPPPNWLRKGIPLALAPNKRVDKRGRKS